MKDTGRTIAPGEQLNSSIGLSLVFQGVSPVRIDDVQALCEKLIEAMRHAIAEYTVTLTTDWVTPGGIEIHGRTIVPVPPPAPKPRLIGG